MCVLSEWKVKGWNPEEHLGISGGGLVILAGGKKSPKKPDKNPKKNPSVIQ